MIRIPSNIAIWNGEAIKALVEAITGLLILGLIFLAVLTWAVIRLASLVLPAMGLALLILVAAAIPVHLATRAFIGPHCQHRLSHLSAEISELEQDGAPYPTVRRLEQQFRSCAQAFCNDLRRRRQRLRRRLTRAEDKARRPLVAEERELTKQLESLRVGHGVVPEYGWWEQFASLHSQTPAVRWAFDHPRAAGWIACGGFALLVMTIIAAGSG